MTPVSLLAEASIGHLLDLAAVTPLGPFVEVGVYQGGSAWRLAELARKQGRALHLFDTFAGMPWEDTQDVNHHIGDFSDTDLPTVQEAIPDAIFHVGIFPDTLPPDLTDIAFVHADCDQYRSVKAVIQHLYPRMLVGGVILFDDYPSVTGATLAVDESGLKVFRTENGQGKGYVRKQETNP